MPLLEYRCAACGSVFERLVQRTHDAETARCTSCGANSGRRLLSVFAQVRGGDGATTAASAVAGGCCGGGGCSCRQ